MTQTATFDAQADQNSVISQTVAPAFVANIWRSQWVNVKAHRRLTGIIACDQALIGNGVVLEQSESDAPAADSDAHYFTAFSAPTLTNPITGHAAFTAAYSVERVGRWARLVVQHNGVAPTVFVAKVIGAGIT